MMDKSTIPQPNNDINNKDEMDWLQILDHKLLEWLWKPASFQKGPKGWGFFVLRVVHLSIRNAFKEHLPFSANALTFITLLGLVPALAISFALAKGLGFANPLRELLLNNEFLASQREILEQLIVYVEKTQVSTLGIMGLVLLVFTMIMIISSVEQVFNRIWEAGTQRSWLRKFTDYFSVMVIFPVLVFAATGAWAAFSSHQVVQWFLDMAVVGKVAKTGMSLGPLLMLSLAFAFIYLFLPNTHVPLTSALVAGVTTAVLWWGVQSLYIYFQVGVARYNAIYGGFATLPLFMVWLHVSWTVVLFGGQVAHAHRVCLEGPLPRFVYAPLTPAQKEALGLQIMHRLAISFHEGFGPLSMNHLAKSLGMPLGEVQSVTSTLAHKGLVTKLGAEGFIQPGKSLDTITLGEIWQVMRGASGQDKLMTFKSFSPIPTDILAKAQEQAFKSMDKVTLLDLIKNHALAEKENSGSA